MACGIPIIARNDGGNPEIIGTGGELFDNDSDIPALIEKIYNKKDRYKPKTKSIKEAATEYIQFIENIKKIKKSGKTIHLQYIVTIWKINEIINKIKNKIHQIKKGGK